MADEEKPPEKPTVKFEAPPSWAESMFQRVHERMSAGFTSVDSRLGDAEGKLDKCIHGLGTVTDEVSHMKQDYYEFKGAVGVRLDSNSMRAVAQSTHDGEQDKQLAKLSESQMAALLKEIAKTPMGQKIANAVGGLLLVLIGVATAWLMTHGGAK